MLNSEELSEVYRLRQAVWDVKVARDGVCSLKGQILT